MIIEKGFISFLNLTVFMFAAFLTYVLTLFFIQISYRFDLLDYPVGRKIHKKPTPFLGGVGVFISFWFVIFLGLSLAYFFNEKMSPDQTVRAFFSWALYLTPKVIWIFVGSLLLLCVGLFDDKFRWSPVQKLAGQVVATVILMRLGLTINLLSSLGALGYLVTFIWILLIINAFNFIDSLDGHCAGIALISSVVFFCITQIINQPLVGLFLVTFSGAMVGFFPHNFKPARIFLGDNGSLFIGYIMAAFTLLCRFQAPETSYVAAFAPLLVFGVPIYDTLSVVLARFLRGMPPWEGDRNHFAHRLVKIGMGERVAVIFSYFIALTLGLVAILTTQVTFFGALLIGLIFFSIIGVIAFLEFYVAQRIRITEELAKRHRRRREDKREAEEERF